MKPAAGTRDPAVSMPGAAGSATRSERLQAWAAVLILLLQPVLFFRHVLINPRAHIPYDLGEFHLPLISYIQQCVRDGHFPSWDPFYYCGMPFHADPQAGIFYPLNWLAILASGPSGGYTLLYWVQWLVPLHMMLAGLLAFWLLRRWRLAVPAALLGASVYEIGAFFASHASHLGAVEAAAWLPLSIVAVDELRIRVRPRWVAVLAAATALTVLAGMPATVIVVAGSALLFALALVVTRAASWRLLAATAAGFGGGLAIAAVQLIPMAELTPLSIASLRSIWGPQAEGMPLESLASLVIPNYYHIFQVFTPAYRLPYNYTLLYAYCGIVPLVLFCCAPFLRKHFRAFLFFALTIASAFWMLGEFTPVYRALRLMFPSTLRAGMYPFYVLMAFTLFGGITAAIVLDHFGRRTMPLVLWVIALVASADLMHGGSGRPMNSGPGGYKERSSEFRLGEDPPALDKMRAMVHSSFPPVRIDYYNEFAWPTITGADMLRLPTPSGNNPLMLRRMWELRNIYCDLAPAQHRQFWVKNFDSPLLDMVNTGVLVGRLPLTADQIRSARLEPAGTAPGLHFYRNPHALPRFFLVPRVRRSPGEAETMQHLADPNFRPAEEAVVEGAPQDEAGLAQGTVTVAQYEADRVQLSVAVEKRAFLASSEALYPGWEATVNGKPAQLLMTNGVFRGMFLPAGKNEIVMTYHRKHFRLGAFLSLAALVVTMAAVVGGDGILPWQ